MHFSTSTYKFRLQFANKNGAECNNTNKFGNEYVYVVAVFNL